MEMKKSGNKLNLRTPIVIASGPGGFGEYFEIPTIDWALVGAYTLKTVTLNRKIGNKPPRIYAKDGYVINRIGLENPGFEGFKALMEERGLEEVISHVPVILSVGGDTFDEYVELTRLLKPYLNRFIAIEYNFSCPNVQHGGLSIVSDKNEWRRLLQVVRKETDSFIIAKLGIEGGFIEQMAEVAASEGWNGVTVINTIRGLMIDGENRVVLGGLSGPNLFPIALRAVYEVRKRLPDIYIIASGGVYTPDDAKLMIEFGADAVSIGSALFKNESVLNEIGKSLQGIQNT
ncbi:MAG: tRNA-dihydrouridine synthase [Fervidobacterium sp.]|uniref:Dihydroorotate oxidase B, catalytic subunit n=1 Tax=Fervidobacterium gondwanense DSM 13020 TaxID=1121883 RepID=A0A1M7SZM0_FERGO|nr:tRNA-dihydrouridine synthase [Fervidobacterium gondwanense]SHN63953.1 dihydroorotate oxidase B, catalytic subunit [Fervidobacterium gondwanense DSM 13020]